MKDSCCANGDASVSAESDCAPILCVCVTIGTMLNVDGNANIACERTFITVRNEVAKVVFTPICHSVHRGVCLSACRDTTPLGPGTPGTRHPLSLGADTPLGPGTPREQTPALQTATVADGTHPTRMHSCTFNVCLPCTASPALFLWERVELCGAGGP